MTTKKSLSSPTAHSHASPAGPPGAPPPPPPPPPPPSLTGGPVTVTSSDVLSGRYNYSFNHEGNNFFRDAIQAHREEYQEASRRAIKNRITQTVIGLVQKQRNGRFLKLNDKNQWEVMDEVMVYEKVSHALRGSKKKYMQSKKPASKKTAQVQANGTAAARAGATTTSAATHSTSSVASPSAIGSAPANANATPSYQALASPFVSRAYHDIMAKQRVLFEGMVNGTLLRGGGGIDGDGGDATNDDDDNDNPRSAGTSHDESDSASDDGGSGDEDGSVRDDADADADDSEEEEDASESGESTAVASSSSSP